MWCCGDVIYWGSYLLMFMWYWWRFYIYILFEKFILLFMNCVDIFFYGMIFFIRLSYGLGGKWWYRFDDFGVYCKWYLWLGKENVWLNEFIFWMFFIIYCSYIWNELFFCLFGCLRLFFFYCFFKIGVFCYF